MNSLSLDFDSACGIVICIVEKSNIVTKTLRSRTLSLQQVFCIFNIHIWLTPVERRRWPIWMRFPRVDDEEQDNLLHLHIVYKFIYFVAPLT